MIAAFGELERTHYATGQSGIGAAARSARAENPMRWKVRFSLRLLLLLVAVAAVATFVWLNGRQWQQTYSDWKASRAIQARAERVFREETGAQAPGELVHILGSGDLSHWGRVYDIGLTADQIISCGLDNAVRCWSTETGEPLQVISDVKGYVVAQSSLLLTIDGDNRAQVYDTSTSPLKLQQEFSLTASIQHVFPSPCSAVVGIVYDAQPDEMHLLDLPSGTPSGTLQLDEPVEQFCIGFREDGRMLAAGKDQFLLIDTANGAVVSQWEQEPWPFARQATRHVVRMRAPWWLVVGASTSIVWNEETQEWSDAEVRVGGTPDTAIPGNSGDAWVLSSGTMLTLNCRDGELNQTIVRTTPVMPVSCMALRRYTGGGVIFTLRAVGHGTGQVAMLDEYGRLRLPHRESDHVTAIAWSEDAELLAAGTSAGEITVMQTGSWDEMQRFRAHGGAIRHLEFSPDAAALLSEERHELAVFDWRSGKRFLIKPHQGSISRVATLSSGDGRLLAWVLNEGWTLTDYASNTLVARSKVNAAGPQPFSPQGAVWSEQDQCFVFGTKDGLARLNLVGEGSAAGATLQLVEQANSPVPYLRDLSVATSQALLLDYGKERVQLKLWDWNGSKPKEISVEPMSRWLTAAFAPSGRELAAVSGSDLVLYSHAGDELYRHRIGPSHMNVPSIEFSPDGRYIAIVNGNGTCYLLRNPYQ